MARLRFNLLLAIPFFLFHSSPCEAADPPQSNVPGEVGVYNTQIFYYERTPNPNASIPFSTSSGMAFLPYLAYVSEKGQPRDSMMDGLLLYDQRRSGESPGGSYLDLDYLDLYWDDTFVKARMPLLSSEYFYDPGSFGHALCLKYHRSARQPEIPVLGGAVYTFAAYGRLIDGAGQVEKAGIMAFEVFDAAGHELEGQEGQSGLGGTVLWSSYFGFWYSYLTIDDSWKQYKKTVLLPPEAAALSPYLAVGFSDYTEGVYYDYAQLVAGGGGALLGDAELERAGFSTLLSDGGFEEGRLCTKWETAVEGGGSLYLFKDRLCAMDGVSEALSALAPVRPALQPVKILLMLPGPQDLSAGNLAEYMQRCALYVERGCAAFQDWKAEHQAAKAVLAGFYITNEGLPDNDPTQQALWCDFLAALASDLHGRGIGLFASPYDRMYSGVKSAILPELYPFFDCLWMQPNAFYKGDAIRASQNVDLEILRMTAEYALDHALGINVERTGTSAEPSSQEAVFGYGRQMDYFDYGYKYGYVNLAKCYYDRYGDNWHSAFSSDPIDREQYDALYRFIKSTHAGYLVNGDFESSGGPGKLYNWEGDYAPVPVDEADIARKYRAAGCDTNAQAYTKHKVPVGESLRIRFDARESDDDGIVNSALVGFEFFDADGVEIKSGYSDLTWSGYLDLWYCYVPTETTWKTFDWTFSVPGGVSAIVYLRNWFSPSMIAWDNVELPPRDAVGFQAGSGMGAHAGTHSAGHFLPGAAPSSPPLLNPESRTLRFHTHCPIRISEGGPPAFNRAPLHVHGGEELRVDLMVKETAADQNPLSALFGLDAFDGQMNPITPLAGIVQGLEWSESLGFWYSFIPVDKTTDPDPWYDSEWTQWQQSFILPAQTKYLRFYLYNESSDPLDDVLFQHPMLTRP